MEASAYRERIYETFADPETDVTDRVARALEVGTEYLGVDIGFLTRIYGGTQEVVQVEGSHELLRPGDTCPLDEAYCRRTVERDSPLAVQDATASAAIRPVAVDRFGLGTYIGARVTVDGEVYGTVCFADGEAREAPFDEATEVFIELLAELVGQAMEQRAHEQELRRRNERLREEKRRFKSIAETSFDVVFRVDDASSFTYVSPAVERVLGFTPAEMVGSQFPEFVAPTSVDDAMAGHSRALEASPIEGLELEFLDADGDTVVVEVNATPITDGGEVVAVQGVGRDITARLEREEELRIKNRAMDEARVGITIADADQPDTPLIYLNDGFERLTGYDETAALGRNCRFLQGAATDPAAVSGVAEGIETDEPTTREVLNYRKDGTPFWNQLRVGPIADDAGEVTHYLGIQADITERKRTEQLVRLLNRVLRHNLRNDLNVVRGSASLICERTDGEVAELGSRIERTAQGLLDLSEQARELERVARRDREPGRLNPATMLEAVAEEARERDPDATVTLTLDTERDLCAGPEVERAVAELVENGLEHDDSDSPRVDIGVTERDDGAVAVTVSDEGPGISEMEATVISEGQETPLQHGTGLGLWLVNWIVTRYGGSFQISPEQDGTGTVATVVLPGMGPDDDVAESAGRPTVLSR
jgi:PAS domain S-box-containing protein